MAFQIRVGRETFFCKFTAKFPKRAVHTKIQAEEKKFLIFFFYKIAIKTH